MTAFASSRGVRWGVRLLTRNGHDFGERFRLIVAAVAALPARSCPIGSEAIVSDDELTGWVVVAT
jgi:ATP-dependent DNA ligase